MGRLKGMLAAQVLCTVITFFYGEQIVSNTDWKSLAGRSQCQSYKWNFWSCQWTTGWANNGKIRKDNSEGTVFLRKFRKAWDLKPRRDNTNVGQLCRKLIKSGDFPFTICTIFSKCSWASPVTNMGILLLVFLTISCYFYCWVQTSFLLSLLPYSLRNMGIVGWELLVIISGF